ncbi:hypothetical protein L6452_32561 [Arctium lappa]|uniref:Uncharacterized protein n=1 Tax=Arctium lappa TaxID=4217 RepID=A0ACB8Z666_ARCLA|nr:hypothetical protein L6452_32561 [Arctium lappa]
MFSIINRCLTARHTGVDNTNMHSLRLFHAIVYDLDVDYSIAIWTELYDKVLIKRTSKKPIFVRYQRFLQLIIKSMLRSNRDIPKRHNHEVGPEFGMRYLQKQKQSFNYSMAVPEALHIYVDPNSRSVTAYRESTGRPAPVAPSHDSILRIVESVRVQTTMRVLERGKERENYERGNVGGQSSRIEVEENANDGQNSETELDHAASFSSDSIPSATTDINDDDNANDDDDDDENIGHSFGFLNDNAMDIDDAETTIMNVVGDIRRTKGDIVENVENVRMSENV